jgi:HEAT repeat protein
MRTRLFSASLLFSLVYLPTMLSAAPLSQWPYLHKNRNNDCFLSATKLTKGRSSRKSKRELTKVLLSRKVASVHKANILHTLQKNPVPELSGLVGSLLHSQHRSLRWSAAAYLAKQGMRKSPKPLLSAFQRECKNNFLLSSRQKLKHCAHLVEALARSGKAGKQTYLKWLEGKDLTRRSVALMVLAKVRPLRWKQLLRQHINHPQQTLRSLAIRELGKYGTSNVVPLLTKQLSHPSYSVRLQTIQALARFRTTQSLNALLNALETEKQAKKTIVQAIFLHGNKARNHLFHRVKTSPLSSPVPRAIFRVALNSSASLVQPQMTELLKASNKTVRCAVLDWFRRKAKQVPPLYEQVALQAFRAKSCPLIVNHSLSLVSSRKVLVMLENEIRSNDRIRVFTAIDGWRDWWLNHTTETKQRSSARFARFQSFFAPSGRITVPRTDLERQKLTSLLKLLGTLHSPHHVKWLLKQSHHPNSTVRRAIVEVLKNQSPALVRKRMKELKADKNEQIRKQAAQWLLDFNKQHWKRDWKQGNKQQRRKAAEKLLKTRGELSWKAAVWLVKEGGWKERILAVDLLKKTAPRSLRVLVRAYQRGTKEHKKALTPSLRYLRSRHLCP